MPERKIRGCTPHGSTTFIIQAQGLGHLPGARVHELFFGRGSRRSELELRPPATICEPCRIREAGLAQIGFGQPRREMPGRIDRVIESGLKARDPGRIHARLTTGAPLAESGAEL